MSEISILFILKWKARHRKTPSSSIINFILTSSPTPICPNNHVQRFTNPNHREKLISENAAASLHHPHAIEYINSGRLWHHHTCARTLNLTNPAWSFNGETTKSSFQDFRPTCVPNRYHRFSAIPSSTDPTGNSRLITNLHGRCNCRGSYTHHRRWWGPTSKSQKKVVAFVNRPAVCQSGRDRTIGRETVHVPLFDDGYYRRSTPSSD